MAETVGSLADKLSIVELKLYHMREQVDRADVTDAFRANCRARVAVLEEQRDDLAAELTTLLDDVLHGRRTLKVYRQYKMYNDPAYRAAPTPAASGPAPGSGAA